MTSIRLWCALTVVTGRLGVMYEPRITQLDARLTRTFRYGRTRLQANLDLYNLFNASSVLAMNTRFGPQ